MWAPGEARRLDQLGCARLYGPVARLAHPGRCRHTGVGARLRATCFEALGTGVVVLSREDVARRARSYGVGAGLWAAASGADFSCGVEAAPGSVLVFGQPPPGGTRLRGEATRGAVAGPQARRCRGRPLRWRVNATPSSMLRALALPWWRSATRRTTYSPSPRWGASPGVALSRRLTSESNRRPCIAAGNDGPWLASSMSAPSPVGRSESRNQPPDGVNDKALSKSLSRACAISSGDTCMKTGAG